MNEKRRVKLPAIPRELTDVEVNQLQTVRLLLRQYLIHTRDVLDGRDFLFSGPENQLQDALRALVAIEYKARPFLHLDYARIEEYFLLRVTGPEAHVPSIRTYLD